MILLKKIDVFIAKDFKKRFISIISIPLLLSTFFLVDFYLLPEISKTDSISQYQIINIPKSAGGTSARTSHKVGYKYLTNNNYKFSTSSKRAITSHEIDLTISPVFNTVKTVMIENKKTSIESGFNGVKGVLLVLCNGVIIISIFCALMINRITEHSRQNLIFVNIFFFLIWGYTLILYF